MDNPTDQKTPLSSARPALSERLRMDDPGIPDVAEIPTADYMDRRRLQPAPRSFIKRVERYFSGLRKLGRIYGTLKDTAQELGIVGARVSALSGDVAALRKTHHRLETRMAEIDARIEEMATASRDKPDHPALPDTLEGIVDDLRAQIAQTGAALNDRIKSADALAKMNASSTSQLTRDIGHIRTELSETASEFRHQRALGAAEQASLSRAYTDLTRRIDTTRHGASTRPDAPDAPSGLDALIETFYARLEDRYRGSREEIAKRLVKYLPDAEAAVARTGKPLLDLGCGRGEWLESLRRQGVDAVGVDLNDMQLHEARALGLNVHHGDAIGFLSEADDASYGMITAHHLAEHMPFDRLVWMTREALRVLAPGGVILYETPNVRNVVVGASSFHIDPTHMRPLPAELLETVFDTIGFHPVEIRFLHVHPKYDEIVRTNRLDSEIAGLLFGPQDLTILGTKPGEVA